MNLYLQLFWEFFKTGLFAVGGGMATLPFLADIGQRTGWYTYGQLMNMLAVSESTPGPIGINMATYVGYTVGGAAGAAVATLGEVTPSIVVILIVAAILQQFRHSRFVESAFYGLRPASTALVGAAGAAVIFEVLLRLETHNMGAYKTFSWDGGVNLPGLALAAVLLALTNWVKPTKKLHPVVFILLSAGVGALFRFGGA